MHTTGRSVAARARSAGRPPRAATTAAPHRSQAATSPQAAHASSRERPSRLSTHTTRAVGARGAQERRVGARTGRRAPAPRRAGRRPRPTGQPVPLPRCHLETRRRRGRAGSAPATRACTARRPDGPARRRRRGRARSAPAPTGAPRRARRARRSAEGGVGHRRPHRDPRPDHDVVPPRRAAVQSATVTSPASSAMRWPSRRSRPGETDRQRRRPGTTTIAGPDATASRDERQPVGRRREALDHGDPDRSPRSSTSAGAAGAAGTDAGRRGGPQQVDPAAGPAPRRPPGEVDDLRRRTGCRSPWRAASESTPGAASLDQRDDPAPHPPAVQVDADDRPDAHLVPERVRDQVVERPARPPAGRAGPGRSRRRWDEGVPLRARGRTRGRRPGWPAPR